MSAADEVKALERERSHYEARGDKHRADQVAEQLARLTAPVPEPRPDSPFGVPEADEKPAKRSRRKADG